MADENAVMDAPPPAAPEPSPSPAPAAPAAPTAPAIDKGPQQASPKPGSAKERMFKDLRQKYGGEPPDQDKPTGKDPNATDAHDTSGDHPDKTAASDTQPPAAASGEKGKGKPASPWKLLDAEKAARLKAETEASELRKQIGDPVKAKEVAEQFKKIQERNKELEEEIRFVNYSKSKDFQEKYQKPYEAAWQKWMGELGELTVTDSATQAERNLQPQDLLELVNMPLQKARAHAQDVYGAFADDVMAARKELRSLWDQQQSALSEARKVGEGWQARLQQEFQQKRQAMTQEITNTWKQANDSAIKDEKYGQFFKPIDGDEEGNQRLARGFEMADKAFAVNPFDPRLTPEQRAEIIQLHAAVRHRSAAFGRMLLQHQRDQEKITKLTTELGKFKSAEPGAVGQRQTNEPQSHGSAKDEVFGALRKLAH